jgi:hypothetical protein
LINIGKGVNEINRGKTISLDYENGTTHPPPTAGATPRLNSPKKF